MLGSPSAVCGVLAPVGGDEDRDPAAGLGEEFQIRSGAAADLQGPSPGAGEEPPPPAAEKIRYPDGYMRISGGYFEGDRSGVWTLYFKKSKRIRDTFIY